MQDMKNFVELSAVLTGFNRSVLAPGLDPVDIKATYIETWQKNVDSGKNSGLSAEILSSFAGLQDQSPALTDQQIGERLLADENGLDFTMACRKLIYLWYMGAWPEVMASPGTESGGSTSFETLSSKSYTAGLVWQVMQSHPMGDSNYRYGYWAEKPVALADYTGNASDGSAG